MAQDKFPHRHDNPYKYHTKRNKIQATKKIKSERERKSWVQILFGWLIKDGTL